MREMPFCSRHRRRARHEARQNFRSSNFRMANFPTTMARGAIAQDRDEVSGLDRDVWNCHIQSTMNMPIRAPVGAPAQPPFATEVARRRTFAIISHPDAGKTTLTEKLLLFGGAIQLAGQVKAK